ncbi:MAG: hypothetical protein WC783_00850 [Candidatus Paceibacterota bacterium]|jgi:hypothetical protein
MKYKSGNRYYNVAEYISVYFEGPTDYLMLAGHIDKHSAEVIFRNEKPPDMKQIPEDWKYYYGYFYNRKPNDESEKIEGCIYLIEICDKLDNTVPITIVCSPSLRKKGWKLLKG